MKTRCREYDAFGEKWGEMLRPHVCQTAVLELSAAFAVVADSGRPVALPAPD